MANASYIPTLYRTIDLSPEPVSSSSIVRLGPSKDNHTGLFGTSRKRAFNEISGHDEQSFARKHLATETSIHFRRKSDGPRSFLWRVLNDGLLLEIQCVDLVTDKHTEESSLTYHIAFTSPIVPKGVAFADAEKSDALQAFVLTANNELSTITIKRDFLVRTAVPSDPNASIDVHLASALSFRRPFKLVAVSSLELIITLHDGGLLRLDRASEETQWKETHFSEGGWTGSLRGLISLKRQQTVRHGDLDLDTSAAVSVAKSPDNNFIWTVTLDHTLTAWDQRTGKIVARRDVLGGSYEHDKRKPPYVMPGEQGSLLQLVPPSKDTFKRVNSLFDEDSQYHLVIYSPKQRCFKIYCGAISSALTRADSPVEDEPPRLFDFLDGYALELPFDELLDTNLWRIADFHFKPGDQWNESRIWIRVQSGTASKVFTLKFSLFDGEGLAADLEERWKHGWSSVTERGFLGQLPIAEDGDPSHSWLTFLSYPGRYPDDLLETALQVYQQRRKSTAATNKALQSAQSLQARLTSAISRGVSVPTTSERPDYQQYYNLLRSQWSGFYTIVQDLQTRRSELLSFAVDDSQDLVWLLSADIASPACQNDRLGAFLQNGKIDDDDSQYEYIADDVKAEIISDEDDWDILKLLLATTSFAKSLPASIQHAFANIASRSALTNDLDAESFFSIADIGRQVSDESYQSLEQALQPLNGIGGLTDGVFIGLLDLINSGSHRGTKTGALLTQRGSKAMIKLAQDFVQRDKSVVLDLLALITFINNDFEHKNLDEEFHIDRLFDLIMKQLRELELRDWLVKTPCLEPSRGLNVRSTIFESLFIGDWDSHAPKDLEFAAKITHWARQWTFAPFQDWQGFTSNVLATLLKHDLYQDAQDFEKFLEASPWTTYLLARLYLALGREDEAALLFSSVSKDLSTKRKGEIDTAGLLSPEEHAYIGAGQDQYFMHVANMFEKQQLYAYTADFAEKALLFIDERHVQRELHEIDKRRSVTDSPLDKVTDARAEIKLLQLNTAWEAITSRLYNAQLLTGRFEQAFATLARMNRPDLKRSNLHRLVESMLSHGSASILLELPLDDDLASEADKVLAQVAKKNLVSGTVKRGPQQILYAYRIKRGDYRGAAEVMYEQLERLRHAQGRNLRDPEDEALPQAYLVLINTLVCCGGGEEWLLADPILDIHPPDARRKLVTLTEVRQQYVAELDRRSDLQHGRFPLVDYTDADEMDVL